MPTEKDYVLVTHPGRQHSHQVALALQNKGILAGYWAGVPSLKKHAKWLPRLLWRRHIRYAVVPLQHELVKWFPVAPILNKMGSRLTSQQVAKYIEYLGYSFFDIWAANSLQNITRDIGAVIAYENSALNTFKAAKRLGIITILDAASLHHQAQDRLHTYTESDTHHKKIIWKKNKEIELADHILTVSALARQTYLDAGVSANRVHNLVLGTDIDMFTPAEEKISREKMQFTFVFVGSTMLYKGIDVLLQAFKKISTNFNVYLKIIGPKGDAHSLIRKYECNQILYEGSKLQQDLVEEYRNADCFILPSRIDSYGMVVAEALACGVPVIVSDMVGAKDLVVPGKNGWVVPVNDVDALVKQMTWCIEHRDVLIMMRKAARQSVVNATWQAHHKRLITFFDSINLKK